MVKLTRVQLKINSLLTYLIYPKKPIPEHAVLYKSIHFSLITKTPPYKPNASAFKDRELSCDWNKYSTPEQSRDLIGKQYKNNTKEFKNKLLFFICGITVSENLNLDPEQSFQHDPIYHFPEKKGFPNNRAHSLIIGNKDDKEDVKARFKLANGSKWEIFDEVTLENLRLNR